jgi:hypothetical protein
MLEKPAARRSAVFVLAATVLLTLLTYWAMYALAARAGGAG